MGYLEFLVNFYIINTAWLVKFSDLDFDPLIYHPTAREPINLQILSLLAFQHELYPF